MISSYGALPTDFGCCLDDEMWVDHDDRAQHVGDHARLGGDAFGDLLYENLVALVSERLRRLALASGQRWCDGQEVAYEQRQGFGHDFRLAMGLAQPLGQSLQVLEYFIA